jgi:hypothetical protein
MEDFFVCVKFAFKHFAPTTAKNSANNFFPAKPANIA